MTANILSTELSAIIQESKRKQADLKTSAEKSLQDLKSLHVTSETQLAADLQRRPYFIDPLLTACKSRNAKITLHGVVALQRILSIRGVFKDRVKETLDSFSECSSISSDVQLKILQALPSLLQGYSNELRGDSLALALQLCSVLQQTKVFAVNSTAAATFQQLVSSVFEKLVLEDERAKDEVASVEVVSDNKTISLKPAAADAYKLFYDLCLLMDGHKPLFVRNASLSHSFGLELIATLLSDFPAVFKRHTEQMQILREKLLPLITKLLSERPSFPISVRTIRILCIILRDHVKTLAPDCEVALSLLDHMLEPDGSSPWRRALSMEAFRIIYSTPQLAIELYTRFDANPDRKNIIQDNLGAFVRLASEKPSLIGISQQSTYPTGPSSTKDNSQEQAVLEAGGIAGVISGGDVGVREVSVSGISSQWSSLKVPCLELMDKTEPPTIPETYSYSLALTCISSLSETLARTVLPLIASNDSQGKSIPQTAAPIGEDNSLLIQEVAADNEKIKVDGRQRSLSNRDAKSNTSQGQAKLRMITKMIDGCWPAVLATCSTFLYAALDAEYYRSLIRSFQYFTQVAGLLRLSIPRDALLTTLAKSAVPSHVFKSEVTSTPSDAPQMPFSFRNGTASDSLSNDANEKTRRPSLDGPRVTLTPRNLMCMRALINLAIALGPTLDESWYIILETLQKADLVLAAVGTAARARDYRSGTDRQESDAQETAQANLGTEIAAVETAITRLFASTEDYPNAAFVTLLSSFCHLINTGGGKEEKRLESTPNTPSSPLQHRRQVSFSGMSVNTSSQPLHYQLAIAKLGEIARINLARFAEHDPEESGWRILVEELLLVAASSHLLGPPRASAVDVLGHVTVGIAVIMNSEDDDIRGRTQRRALAALQGMVSRILNKASPDASFLSGADIEVHKSILDSLRSLLEQCGQHLIDGWDIILKIIESPFLAQNPQIQGGDAMLRPKAENMISSRLCRAAFASTQLICSDFLSSLSHVAIVSMTGILSQFCSQSEELNIALTAITLFWNVSDFLQRRLGNFELAKPVNGEEAPAALARNLSQLANDGSDTALWALLLLHLTTITNDSRADVRNGAIHTVLRILDNCGEHLPPQVWSFCIQNIMFAVVDLNVAEHKVARSEASDNARDTVKTLNHTSKIILDGVADLFRAYIEEIMHIPDFESLWKQLLNRFQKYATFGSYELSTIVFTALGDILSAVDNPKKMGKPAISMSIALWSESISTVAGLKDANQESLSDKAFVAHVKSIQQIHRLMHNDVNAKQIKMILDNLYRCLITSRLPAYSSDVDRLTGLQAEVLGFVKTVRGDIPEVPCILISFLSSLVTLPYDVEPEIDTSSQPSYIAFAKAASDHLQSIVIAHKTQKELYNTGTISQTAAMLAHAMDLKYKWINQGSEPSLWRKATETALVLFEHCLPVMQEPQFGKERRAEFWSAVVQVTSAITKADLTNPPPNLVLLRDETFDLESLNSLGILVSPWLGNDSLHVDAQQKLVSAVFDASLIHTYGHYGRSGIPDPPESLFKGLYDVRFGRTVEPPINPRLRISYFCLDQLLTFVSLLADPSASSTASPSPKKTGTSLAKVTLPYFILRCALPLKTYIADQPLRGRLPTPASQRLELLHILGKLTSIDCDPAAIPDWTDETMALLSTSPSANETGNNPRPAAPVRIRILDPKKRHLEWLLPLVQRASKWASRDEEIAAAMRSVIDVALGSSYPY